ncbi:hypothetical protein AZZ76_004986 [Klebsiella pneumoniae]|nr:hypothetical protein AZZ76_004986 [Klebsiella pneumoniae]SVQ75261.1 Uncharacterised protein [Klebsiella pneumoniae]
MLSGFIESFLSACDKFDDSCVWIIIIAIIIFVIQLFVAILLDTNHSNRNKK